MYRTFGYRSDPRKLYDTKTVRNIVIPSSPFDILPVTIVRKIHNYIPYSKSILRLVCRQWRYLHKPKPTDVDELFPYPRLYFWLYANGVRQKHPKEPRTLDEHFWLDAMSVMDQFDEVRLHKTINALNDIYPIEGLERVSKILWKKFTNYDFELMMDIIDEESIKVYGSIPFAICVRYERWDILVELLTFHAQVDQDALKKLIEFDSPLLYLVDQRYLLTEQVG